MPTCLLGPSCRECFAHTGGATPRQGARVAIATVWDGGHSYECAIPLWCQSATKLSKVIPDSQLVMLTPKTTSYCAHAVQLMPQKQPQAAREYLARNRLMSLTKSFDLANLYKFALFSLTRFELLLYADLDIDLARPRLPTRQAWEAATSALLQTEALFVGLFDHATPVNGGLWLARPRCHL
ncbi:MAG: hypothetical protein SGPRY_014583 [Prymnesium sp.]